MLQRSNNLGIIHNNIYTKADDLLIWKVWGFWFIVYGFWFAYFHVSIQCLEDVVEDIVFVFQSYRYANEAGCDIHRCALCFG